MGPFADLLQREVTRRYTDPEQRQEWLGVLEKGAYVTRMLFKCNHASAHACRHGTPCCTALRCTCCAAAGRRRAHARAMCPIRAGPHGRDSALQRRTATRAPGLS